MATKTAASRAGKYAETLLLISDKMKKSAPLAIEENALCPNGIKMAPKTDASRASKSAKILLLISEKVI